MMSNRTDSSSGVGIDGFAHEDFDQVRSVFAENFAERGEVGAAVTVYVEGEPVVDLWGGDTVKDGERKGQWERDTLVCLFSINKSVTALCAHRLADQGKLDYHKPVAHYWPEFAQAGKEEITVDQLMASLAAMVFPDEVPDGQVFDWEAMVDGLAKTTPAWEVGTRGAYHTSTYGHLVGELVRRVTGQMPGDYFRAEIADPLGIDYWFSVPPAERHRLSEVLPNPESVVGKLAKGTIEKGLRAWRVAPHPDIVGLVNDPQYGHEVMPSAFGRGNARAIGKLYAALSLGGTLEGYTILSPETLTKATTQQWEGADPLMPVREYRYAMGLFLNSPPLIPMGPNTSSFGHPGGSSALAFADPDRHLAFAFCTNFPASGIGVKDERGEALIDAAFASIEGRRSR